MNISIKHDCENFDDSLGFNIDELNSKQATVTAKSAKGEIEKRSDLADYIQKNFTDNEILFMATCTTEEAIKYAISTSMGENPLMKMLSKLLEKD